MKKPLLTSSAAYLVPSTPLGQLSTKLGNMVHLFDSFAKDAARDGLRYTLIGTTPKGFEVMLSSREKRQTEKRLKDGRTYEVICLEDGNCSASAIRKLVIDK